MFIILFKIMSFPINLFSLQFVISSLILLTTLYKQSEYFSINEFSQSSISSIIEQIVFFSNSLSKFKFGKSLRSFVNLFKYKKQN